MKEIEVTLFNIKDLTLDEALTITHYPTFNFWYLNYKNNIVNININNSFKDTKKNTNKDINGYIKGK